ncbi:unnamed protein product, partial [marine sediment metagenome]
MKRAKTSRALSPVIATVVLLATTIMVAVAVSYWMGGVADTYMDNEILEAGHLTTVDAVEWTVTFSLKNAGPDPITFLESYVNGAPI